MPKTATDETPPASASVCSRVVKRALLEQDAVTRLRPTALQYLGRTPGVRVKTGRDGRLQVTARVALRYGAGAAQAGPAAQQAVIQALERVTNQPVGAINLVVAGFKITERAHAGPRREKSL